MVWYWESIVFMEELDVLGAADVDEVGPNKSVKNVVSI